MKKLLLAACLSFGLASIASAQDNPIKVGSIYPMSGPAGPSGIDASAAVRVQVNLINKKGGLLGRKLVVSQKDDEGTPAVGVSRANELIGESSDVIFEGRRSPVTLAMQPIIAAADVLDITCSAKAEAVLSGRGNPLAIRIISSNKIDANVIADHVIDSKASRVAIMVENDAYGNDFLNLIQERLKDASRSIDIVAVEKFPFSSTDFRVPLTEVKSANSDMVIVINAATSGMLALIDQYKQAGIKAQFVSGITLLTPEVFDVAKDQLNGMIGGSGYLPKLPPLNEIPKAKEFAAAYKAETGREPGEEAGIAAQAVSVWASAVEKTKSLDRKTVAAAIRGNTVNDTLFGDVEFDDKGQMLTKPSLFRVVDGSDRRLELVK